MKEKNWKQIKIVSIEWLTKASNQGHVNAMYELAIIYEDNSSLISSTSLLINSSKLGLGKSSYYLASKEARANDNDLALYWYKKSL